MRIRQFGGEIHFEFGIDDDVVVSNFHVRYRADLRYTFFYDFISRLQHNHVVCLIHWSMVTRFCSLKKKITFKLVDRLDWTLEIKFHRIMRKVVGK